MNKQNGILNVGIKLKKYIKKNFNKYLYGEMLYGD